MKEGILKYNPENERMGIQKGGFWIYSGFHCGDVMEVKIDNEWQHKRIEYYEKTWFLVDYGEDIEGLEVRIGD